MNTLSLAGSWQLTQDGRTTIPGHLPGCTYLDFMASGMPDPFYGENEKEAEKLAHHDYRYERSFDVPAGFLSSSYTDLVCDGLDTLCTLTLNGKEIGRTNNLYRTWRFPVKDLLHEGTNTIRIDIANPFPYMAEKAKNESKIDAFANKPGAVYLRKTPCHFGWDWGPKLTPAGLIGFIQLESYDARLFDVRILQHHHDGHVQLDVTALLVSGENEADGRTPAPTRLPADGLSAALSVTDPDGNETTIPMTMEEGKLRGLFDIEEPQLWWCNGLGDQPLYQVSVTASMDGRLLDEASRTIGLRTIELNTQPDKDGTQFQFVINGVPLFAKGADWIPADSFYTRITKEDVDFYIRQARRANMNMLRVWGGGMYESEDFYDACDRYGILIWQDFIFSDGTYPFNDPEFVENVRAEVEDNVRRIRSHASLALWCGNNENEVLALKEARRGTEKQKAQLPFYHVTLRRFVTQLDPATPYWPGSPSIGVMDPSLAKTKPGNVRGDSHLWQVWHGLEPIEWFRTAQTRFCSEFGMESMPSMQTIRTFTDERHPQLLDSVMQAHQKSVGGNEKMLYYLLARYRNPRKFEDFVYLSQIVQADTIRSATDSWRRRKGFTNGCLFWQLNDCWPVASWSAIDYHKQLKAVMYQARHFNQMICLSTECFDDHCVVYAANDTAEPLRGLLEWSVEDFYGNVRHKGQRQVRLPATGYARLGTLDFSKSLHGIRKEKALLHTRLYRMDDAHGGDASSPEKDRLVDEQYSLLVQDKNADLPEAVLMPEVTEKDGQAVVTVSSAVFARCVYLEVTGVTAPWSDNFFDIPAGKSVTVSVPLPETMTLETFRALLKIKSLTVVEPANSRLKDQQLRASMIARKGNWMSSLLMRYLLS